MSDVFIVSVKLIHKVREDWQPLRLAHGPLSNTDVANTEAKDGNLARSAALAITALSDGSKGKGSEAWEVHSLNSDQWGPQGLILDCRIPYPTSQRPPVTVHQSSDKDF